MNYEFYVRLEGEYIAIYEGSSVVVEAEYSDGNARAAIIAELDHHINILQKEYGDKATEDYESEQDEFERMKDEYLPMCIAAKEYIKDLKF